MTLFTGLFTFRSEPDGTSVSRLELEGLHRAQRTAEVMGPFRPSSDHDGMQIDEMQRTDRMRHIQARLHSVEGLAKDDFTDAVTHGRPKVAFDRER